MIEYLSGQSLEDILTEEITIVDFFADWCGPCRMMGEQLESINDIKIIKINVDEHEDVAKEHGVMSIPTIEIYKNKAIVNRFIGFKTAEELKEIIEKL